MRGVVAARGALAEGEGGRGGGRTQPRRLAHRRAPHSTRHATRAHPSHTLPTPAPASVAMVFVPNDDGLEAQARAIYERVAAAEGFTVLGWRDVPIDPRWPARLAWGGAGPTGRKARQGQSRVPRREAGRGRGAAAAHAAAPTARPPARPPAAWWARWRCRRCLASASSSSAAMTWRGMSWSASCSSCAKWWRRPRWAAGGGCWQQRVVCAGGGNGGSGSPRARPHRMPPTRAPAPEAWADCTQGLHPSTTPPPIKKTKKTSNKTKQNAPSQAAELGEAASDFYTCTLSSRTIVYKGMLNSSAVGPFYKDLKVRPCGSEWCMEKKRA